MPNSETPTRESNMTLTTREMVVGMRVQKIQITPELLAGVL